MMSILDKARNMSYNSFEYIDEESIKSAQVVCNDNSSIILTDEKEDKVHLYWAAISCNSLVDSIKRLMLQTPQKKLYLEFVPESFVGALESIGFKIVSNFVDFWCYDIKKMNTPQNEVIIREIRDDECQRASDITLSSKGLSRGFNGETKEFIDEWRNAPNSCVLVAEHDGDIVGMCCLQLYGFDSEKGIVLWLREIAVEPSVHSQGIGSMLIKDAFKWGIENGAKRSFLACDTDNKKAIKLYERFGYIKDAKSGQINMQN